MEILTWSRGMRALTAGLLAAAGAACGSDDPRPAAEPTSLAARSHDAGGNRPPVVSELRIDPDQPTVGERVRAVARIHDEEDDPIELRFRWSVDGEEQPERDAELELADASKGATIEVRVTASDGFSESEPATALVRIIDRAPVMNGIAIAPTRSVYPGDSVTVTPTATDPDGDFLSYDFEWFVNGELRSTDSASFSSEGLASGDRIHVRVTARDGSNTSRAVESEDVVVGSAHPEFVSSPPGLTDAGVFRYAVEAKDPDGDRNLRYRLATAPEGMTIDEVLGTIEWRPRPGQVGVHPVAVVVSDSSRLETTQSFDVTVSASGPADAAAE